MQIGIFFCQLSSTELQGKIVSLSLSSAKNNIHALCLVDAVHGGYNLGVSKLNILVIVRLASQIL